jgi:hypothetical protein
MSRIGVAGLVLLTFALILACLQIYTYRVALENSGAFVGDFPGNMGAINQLVDRSGVKLFVVADYCAYGQFSNPEGSQHYRNSLKTIQQKGSRVEIHVYEPALASKMTAEQFNLQDAATAPNNYSALRNKQVFNAYFNSRSNRSELVNPPDDYRQFLEIMNDQQSKCIDELQRAGIEVHRDVSEPLPVFMWVRDESEEAVFSIYNLGHDSREISQVTRNKHIVLLLKDIATKYLKVK